MARSANNNTSSSTSTAILSRPTEARPIAWAGAGAKNFTEPVTIAEAIEEANLGFGVEKQTLVHFTDDEISAILNNEPSFDLSTLRSRVVANHKATVRDDNGSVLGIVGKDYGVVQNAKAFEFIDFIEEVAGVEPRIETAGTFRGGAQVFVTARLGGDSFLSPDDAVRNYVVFTNTHDGSGSVMAFFTPVRIVCQNTLNMAIAGASNKLTFRHTSRVNERLDWQNEENKRKAYEVFAQGTAFSQKFMEAMLGLRDTQVSSDYVKEFAASIYLSDKKAMNAFIRNGRSAEGVDEISGKARNKINGLLDSIEYGVGQDLYRGSKLWLINGVTTFAHNELKYKDAETEFLSTLSGDLSHKVQKAYNSLVASGTDHLVHVVKEAVA